MNEKQKNGLLIVFGLFVILAGIPNYIKTNKLEDLIVYIVPGLVMIGLGVYKLYS